ncbi:MAG: ABC-type antimicrobial peptide transport system, ATPase component [uncultured Chloroflexia bacterium]|uniref:ABC-type antimicrobial peptide transport system, ATPase component n=1 Tax=uncultured Chloroflexia bacterium TaxID=1672391 RepID=A0A6J4JWF9_9CHLR|nr:MAG: ABC-type antimicrobial peptide transport system, ATPase component [uncultured Chloroflexia bacterium]
MSTNGQHEPLITITGLSKSFEEAGKTRSVLHDVDTTFDRGEFVVLLGKSGSGKSTLLNLLGGIDTPSAGTIRIAGIDVTGLREHERTLFRRKHIGFIFQFYNLLPTLTVGENVLLPLELNGAADARGRAHALELLERVGLADRRDSYPDRLSGGEQQRVAIARALAHDPLLILADEPTGNLDVDTGAIVLDLLDSLTRQADKNLVMATHSAEVIGYADRIFRIEDGVLHAQEALAAARGRRSSL